MTRSQVISLAHTLAKCLRWIKRARTISSCDGASWALGGILEE